MLVAERAQRTLSELSDGRYSFSGGVTVDVAGHPPQELYRRADDAAYRARPPGSHRRSRSRLERNPSSITSRASMTCPKPERPRRFLPARRPIRLIRPKRHEGGDAPREHRRAGTEAGSARRQMDREVEAAGYAGATPRPGPAVPATTVAIAAVAPSRPQGRETSSGTADRTGEQQAAGHAEDDGGEGELMPAFVTPWPSSMPTTAAAAPKASAWAGPHALGRPAERRPRRRALPARTCRASR